MAFRDYITCGECETKIIYDGYDNGRDRLEKIWGDPNANSWTVHLLCPDCIKKMRVDLAAARADAERYRWLRDTRRIALGPIVGQRPAMGESGCRYVIAHGSIARVAHDIETLDAAIDAAIDGEKK